LHTLHTPLRLGKALETSTTARPMALFGVMQGGRCSRASHSTHTHSTWPTGMCFCPQLERTGCNSRHGYHRCTQGRNTSRQSMSSHRIEQRQENTGLKDRRVQQTTSAADGNIWYPTN
jgi:hypothetical protein